ncbi:MAG TPA: hypothetical protein VLC91_13485, partial [Spongiibacteraceae bacterium]|nr:hypothetical protein [Spongiibacteraceae bacterium]
MKTLKNILAVAVIATSAQSAFAYWDTGVSSIKTGVNDGEAILTLWDATNQVSYSQDLGVRYSALYNGSAFNGQSISLDATALSIFGGNFSGVNWNIAAANSHTKNGAVNAYAGAGFIMSYQSALTLTAPGGIATTVSTNQGFFAGYQVNLGMNDPASVIANEVRSGNAAGSGATGYQADWINNYIAPKQDPQAYDLVGSSMNLWFTGFGNNAGTQSAVTLLGSVTL